MDQTAMGHVRAQALTPAPGYAQVPHMTLA